MRKTTNRVRFTTPPMRPRNDSPQCDVCSGKGQTQILVPGRASGLGQCPICRGTGLKPIN